MPHPLFDTNIVIDWLRRREPAFIELSLYSHHRISRVTWSEVLAGEPLGTRNEVKHLLSRFEVIELDESVALAAAGLRHGTRLKLLDAFILATAQLHGVILVTRNTKDFPATMPGIRVPYIL